MSSTDSTARSNPAPRPARSQRRAALLALACLTLLYAALVVPVIVSGRGGTNEAGDERMYHLPVIRAMVDQWPRPDIVRYQSTTSPGYHLLMAALVRAAGDERRAMPFVRAANATLTWGLLAAVFLVAASFTRPWTAAALTLPLLLSPYTLGAGVWLTTDNAGWCFVFIALGGSIAMRRYTPARGLALGVAAALAVGVRQIHVWTLAPIGAVGLLASPLAWFAPRWLRREEWGGGAKWSNLAVACLAGALPLALLLWFAWLWGGLTPPAYRDKHDQGMNLAAPAFALALTGFFGVFFLPAARRELLPALRRRSLWLCVWLAGAAALLPETSYLRGKGFRPRANGWLWSPIVERTPDLAERSLPILALALAGGAILYALHAGASRAGRGPQARLLLLSVLAWLAAQTMYWLAWLRYFEQMILAVLIWLAAMGAPPTASRRDTRWLVLGALALACFQATLSAATMYREVIEHAPFDSEARPPAGDPVR